MALTLDRDVDVAAWTSLLRLLKLPKKYHIITVKAVAKTALHREWERRAWSVGIAWLRHVHAVTC